MTMDHERDVLTARALRVPLNADHPDPEIVLDAASIIRQGGLVAYPTETFYGLAVDPFNAAAVERLFLVKGRPAGSPLILLVARVGQVFDVAQVPRGARTWFDKLTSVFWPGPLTLVLPARRGLRCPALAGGDTVAVRLSPHATAWRLAQTVGSPITSTSANPAGGAPATRADAIDPQLAARLDLILDAGPTPGGPASTLLDLTGARPVIRREGPIDAARIAAVIPVRPLIAAVAYNAPATAEAR